MRTWALTLIAGWSAGCAGSGTERHLAPLYTELSTARGGVRIEGLAGAFLAHRPRPGRAVDQYGLRPFFLHDILTPGTSRTDFLTPFGAVLHQPGRTKWRLTPLIAYDRIEYPDGTSRWVLLTLIGIYVAGYPDGRVVRAWFPFYGKIESMLSYDRLEWVVWPFYMKSTKGDITRYSVLWPFFAQAKSDTARIWRIWPLIGEKTIYGQETGGFMLWPFFYVRHDNLKARPEFRRSTYWAWPFFGRQETHTFQSTSVLWPFFGYSQDSKSGYWAWDGPWPLVRFQRPGTSERATRSRLWPLWSEYEGDRLTSNWWLFPFINSQSARLYDGTRESFFVVPFYQSFEREWSHGASLKWRRIWPLLLQETRDGVRTRAFPSLNPLWRTPAIERMYGWLWELYNDEVGPDVVRQRAVYGIWWREKDADEDRRYISGLWSNRRYTQQGERVSETSLLFGLIRWRSGGPDGSGLLPPALPGPGWPQERVPNSIVPSEAP